MKVDLNTILILCLSLFQFSCGQESLKNPKSQQFPFTAENWSIKNTDDTQSEIKTMIYKNRSALKLEASQKAYLKDKKFKNFTLEFYCNGLSGPGLGFRVQDPQNYEYLYLRLSLSDKKDALQYVPIHNGNLPWQLYNYPKYEGKATFPRKKVGIFPLSMKDELTEGKAGGKLLKMLAEKGFSFSEESLVAFGGETLKYIYDPQEMKALLFEETDNAILLLDVRTWIHVKVEVVEDKASFYIEDMGTPALIVENLKGNTAEGGISLISDGAGVYYADVSIKELQKQKETKRDISKEKLSDNYLTKWNVSEMFTKDSVNYVSQTDSLFHNKSKFKPIQADADGLLNISRFYDDMTKTVALTCRLVSDSDKTVKLNFDYADHLVILLNSAILFDKGMNFQPPPEKGEEGRVFVDDESVGLNLKKGENKLVFMLSADNRQKFNWGVISKLENMDGIRIE